MGGAKGGAATVVGAVVAKVGTATRVLSGGDVAAEPGSPAGSPQAVSATIRPAATRHGLSALLLGAHLRVAHALRGIRPRSEPG